VPDSCIDLARSYVGIAVKAGAARPDIATPSALRATLLGARSVAYSRLSVRIAGMAIMSGLFAQPRRAASAIDI
jgi:hypothetical protein